jgi:hypothetical protein
MVSCWGRGKPARHHAMRRGYSVTAAKPHRIYDARGHREAHQYTMCPALSTRIGEVYDTYASVMNDALMLARLLIVPAQHGIALLAVYPLDMSHECLYLIQRRTTMTIEQRTLNDLLRVVIFGQIL